MIRLITAAIVLATSMTVNAMDRNPLMPVVDIINQTYEFNSLGMKVGDSADYKIDMGFIKGKMHSFVREFTERGIWIQQDMNMGPFGSQKVEVLLDKATGRTLEIRVNGRQQDPPAPGNQEIIETREDKIDVPAGTFEVLYAKIKNKDDGKITQVWMNPEVVSMGGMVKTIAPGQMGEVKVELTAFVKL